MSNDWLVSYPRSGNTWLRYIIEYHLLRPTIGYWNSDGDDMVEAIKDQPLEHHIDAPINNKATWDKKIDYSKKHVLKRHVVSEIEPEQDDKLVFLVRNYKECIMRHCMTSTIAEFELDKVDANNISQEQYDALIDQAVPWFKKRCFEELEVYMSNLQQYDAWAGPKMLVYYEDLILQPTTEIVKVIRFLNCDSNDEEMLLRHKRFMNYYKDHKNGSLQIYAGNGTDPITKGEPDSLRHYSDSFQNSIWGSEMPLELDLKALKLNQELWVRYLKQYRETKK